MSHSQFQLLRIRRFLPLFVTQFLGAFNDNALKNAFAILLTYGALNQTQEESGWQVTLAHGLFILPFFLFSATAGQLADLHDKAKLARAVKVAEVGIMLIAAAGFITGVHLWLFTAIFLMGVHSTFFGPIKYSILPDHLAPDELIAGNALIEAGTFLAILLGLIAGERLENFQATWLLSGVLIFIALLGLVVSWRIPAAPSSTTEGRIGWNIFRETWRIIAVSREDRSIYRAILGISWFWLVGATFLAQFPVYARDVLRGDSTVVTLFLCVFSIGIGLGALACNRMLKGRISAQYAPLAALGMTVFIVALIKAGPGEGTILQTMPLRGAFSMLEQLGFWKILFALLGIAVCGGIYVVPLYTLMQARADKAKLSRIIASNNVHNALFMVVAAVITIVMFKLGLTVPHVFLTIAALNLVVAFYVCALLPQGILSLFFRSFFRLFYCLEVKGLENYPLDDRRMLIVANHQSFLDPPLLSVSLPEIPTFVVNTKIAQAWWIKPFLAATKTLAVDPLNPMSTKQMVDVVKNGQRLAIFPEGRITVTGALMKVYEGPAMIADKADAWLLPVRIEGAQYTHFSRLSKGIRRRFFPKIVLTILPPQRLVVAADLKGKERRKALGRALYDLMVEMFLKSSDTNATLFQSLVCARVFYGSKRPVLRDMQVGGWTYGTLLTRALVLYRGIRANIQAGENVGVLLPSGCGTVAFFFALQARGAVPAMLNFTAGPKNLRSACETAAIKTVYTARAFVQAAKLDASIVAIEEAARVVYLEDVRKHITLGDKLFGVIGNFLPSRITCKQAAIQNPENPAVVLFTSGSEGVPKGVVLSHRNILTNCHQMASIIDFTEQDRFFNALPVFHSFGLTVGTLLPVFRGIECLQYPTPLHYKIIPEVVYDFRATFMFGTDTFLAGYGRHAHPYDFSSLRYVFAGAEKLKEATRALWFERFGVRILEGYGVTETSPAVSGNTPMYARPGTVGRLLPGMRHRLEPVQGIEQGGRLHLGGPNIMLGYLLASSPGTLVKALEEDGTRWHDTGDIVEIDGEGFIRIKGRAKRFAKVGGEMISLAALEEFVSNYWPDGLHAVVSMPDARKGEQLWLFTERADVSREQVLSKLQAAGFPELMAPRRVIAIERIPLLGTGKIDYPSVQKLAATEHEPDVAENDDGEVEE